MSNSSSSDEGNENEPWNVHNLSSSYVQPRNWEMYEKYLTPMYKEGFLEKQSKANKSIWKKRWVIMQDSVLYYFKERKSVPMDLNQLEEKANGYIELDSVASVTTAKDLSEASFQIKSQSRTYIFRAENKDKMNDWLFEFQRSIANIISVLLRSKNESRNRLSNSFSRHANQRMNRSVSFDYKDLGTMFAGIGDDFPGLQNLVLHSDSADSNTEFRNSSSSPRRSSSPICGFGPRSPIGMITMFPLDMLDMENENIGDTFEVKHNSSGNSSIWNNNSFVESIQEEEEVQIDSDAVPLELKICISPPTTRQQQASTNDTYTIPKQHHSEDTVAPIGRWIPRHQREGYQRTNNSSETSTTSTTTKLLKSIETIHFNDDFSYTQGDDTYGVTSLLGVRKSMEDICNCIPDYITDVEPQIYQKKQSLYALFDGHSGVQAATYTSKHFPTYLKSHELFHSSPRTAMTDCFRQIDREFLETAQKEPVNISGTTAAVVFIRGKQLITANIGDSRAVISVNGEALDIIHVQNPGRPDERQRIEAQGGWVREETELNMSKLHSMDLSDPLIKQKAERVVRLVTIYRVNGELAVSRAIGDMDYKGNGPSNYKFWLYPEGHNQQFRGSLVIPDPEFQEIEITPEIEFFVLACDGLWDTITSQEAIDHVRLKLSEGKSVKEASYSLANLAIRSGSSDNVSVIIALVNPWVKHDL